MSDINKGKVISSEHLQKLQDGRCKYKERIGYVPMSDENKHKISESKKRYCNFKHKQETKDKISIASKQHWEDDTYRKSVSDGIKKTFSEFTPEQWRNRLMKLMQSLHAKPNKIEKTIGNILDTLFPGEYKYVGGGDLIIDRKCPDFVNVNGQKKLIEVYGDYWHRNDNPQDRIDTFAAFGYSTLVLWEHEIYDNIELVANRIRDFHLNKTAIYVNY
jgi:very-short-patch-repair endonuclease